MLEIRCYLSTNERVGTGECDPEYFCTFGATEPRPSTLFQLTNLTDPNAGYYGPCSAGHYCKNSVMLKCEAGKYQPDQLKESCLDCQATKYCPEATVTPIDCSDGAYCTIRSERPQFCDIGTYMNQRSA